jgi:hypothetical protein
VSDSSDDNGISKGARVIPDKRTAELLSKIADLLDEGSDPFATPFLTENDIPFEERVYLEGLLAMCVRAFAVGSDTYQKITMLVGAAAAEQKDGAVSQSIVANIDTFYLLLIKQKLLERLE